METVAIDALELANRYAAARGLMRPAAIAHAARLHEAALALHDAAAVFNGAQTKDLQLYFGVRRVFAEQQNPAAAVPVTS